ncbi:hypothetical protein HMPREF1214_03958 [Bacteroides sp. HPS0048]|nr:hypothetical protein HMPREF1214_03958 [Bacteroides sp. HPS0048]
MTILMVVLAVNFTACGNDDDDTSSGASKRITQIKSTYDSGSYTITMNYKDNKLSKYVWIYDDSHNDYEVNQSITYANDKVIIVGIVDGHECEQTYTLNSKGYAASCSIPDIEGRKVEITFEYTETGYLSKAIEITQWGTETSTNTYTFKYQNNNMIEARESDISGYIYTITYGNQTNKAGIANYAIEDILFDYQTAYYAGLLGKPCASLPESYKQMESYNSHLIESGDFIYSVDNDGYVTQSTMSTSRGDHEVKTYSYE